MVPACPAAVAASERAGARAVFSAGEPDERGFFSLTLTVYDAAFNAFQFALSYDPSAVTPVDAAGVPARSFSDFAQKSTDADWMATIGTELKLKSGLVKFAGYVAPGASGEDISEGNVVAGAPGVLLFSFRFQLKKSGGAVFALATPASADYDRSLPEGAALARAGYPLELTVSFQLPPALQTSGGGGGGGGGTPAGPSAPAPVPEKVSAQQLLDDAVLLQIGSRAALVQGGVTAIYPGEPTVTPYIKEQRTYLPIRFLGEAMGITVTYGAADKSVTLTRKADTIVMYVGRTDYLINGVSHQMDAAPEFIPSSSGVRTMVPLRFVAEALAMNVEWDAAERMVIVSPTYTWDMNGSTERAALAQAVGLLKLYGPFVA